MVEKVAADADQKIINLTSTFASTGVNASVRVGKTRHVRSTSLIACAFEIPIFINDERIAKNTRRFAKSDGEVKALYDKQIADDLKRKRIDEGKGATTGKQEVKKTDPGAKQAAAQAEPELHTELDEPPAKKAKAKAKGKAKEKAKGKAKGKTKLSEVFPEDSDSQSMEYVDILRSRVPCHCSTDIHENDGEKKGRKYTKKAPEEKTAKEKIPDLN